MATDSSDYVNGGILSQKDDDGVLHPVAFYSKKLLPAECNYSIFDKELLAIIKCFEEWRPELEGSDIPVKVFSDHRGLEFFMTKKTLSRRQQPWAEFLSEFNFKIQYVTGKANAKADALTRMAGNIPTNANDERSKHQEQTLLGPDRWEISAMTTRSKTKKPSPKSSEPSRKNQFLGPTQETTQEILEPLPKANSEEVPNMKNVLNKTGCRCHYPIG